MISSTTRKKLEAQLVGKDLSSRLGASFLKWDFGTFHTPGIICRGEEQDTTISFNQDWIELWETALGLNDSQLDIASISVSKGLITGQLWYTLMSLPARRKDYSGLIEG